jgi:hypothetical protein
MKKPIQGFVEDLQEDDVYVRFPTLGLSAEMRRDLFAPEDRGELFEGCFVELDLDAKKMTLLRIPPPTEEEVAEAIKQAQEWFPS